MAKKRPHNQMEMLSMNGIRQIKFERYGEAFLSVMRAATAPLPERKTLYSRTTKTADGSKLTPSLRETLSLYEDGIRDVRTMARARALSPSTIANHLGQLLMYGAIPDLDGMVEPEKVALVQRATNGQPIGSIGALKQQLGEQVTYEDLHLIRAWLARK